jgi:hypothetical protein
MTVRGKGRLLALAGAIAGSLLGVGLLLAAPDGPGRHAGRVRVGPNVRMNAPQLPLPYGELGRAAAAIAADPAGRNLVAAWETLQGYCGPPFDEPCTAPSAPGVTAFGTSTDGGRTWTDAGGPPVVDHALTAGHPWLDSGGADGRSFFLVSRASDVVKGYLVGISFYRGRFSGGAFAWSEAQRLAPATPGDYWRSPSLAAAKNGTGAVYAAVSTLRRLCGAPNRGLGQIEVLRSADEGRTWERPVVVGADDTNVTPDPKDPACGTHGMSQLGPSLAVGPRGEVYALWQFGPFVDNFGRGPLQLGHTVASRFSRSLDGGRTFSAPRDVARSFSLIEDPPVGYSKDNFSDRGRIAVAADGPRRGRVYVTYPGVVKEAGADATEQVLVSSQVFLVFSDDQGASWSAPLPLGPPVPPTGVKRFWPTVAVEPGGKVDVIYLESQEREATERPGDQACVALLASGRFRAGRFSSLVDLYWVSSADGGATFSRRVRVTTETSDWCRSTWDLGSGLEGNFGNYLGIAAAGDRTFAVWTDGRSGVPDAYFAEIRSASDGPGARD